jgi:hypothetical protein
MAPVLPSTGFAFFAAREKGFCRAMRNPNIPPVLVRSQERKPLFVRHTVFLAQLRHNAVIKHIVGQRHVRINTPLPEPGRALKIY